MLLDDVAADFPGPDDHHGPPVVALAGRGAISVATHKPNVYIDLSGWSPKYFPPQLVRDANSLLKHKVLFGSDYPLISPDRWLADFEALDIKDEVRPLILKENAIRRWASGGNAGLGSWPERPAADLPATGTRIWFEGTTTHADVEEVRRPPARWSAPRGPAGDRVAWTGGHPQPSAPGDALRLRAARRDLGCRSTRGSRPRIGYMLADRGVRRRPRARPRGGRRAARPGRARRRTARPPSAAAGGADSCRLAPARRPDLAATSRSPSTTPA